MGFLSSLLPSGGKYFDKKISPKCDYCRLGKRAKDGNKVLCERKGLVDSNSSCGKFIYSPLKRIPVKQLNFVGSLADEDLYIESAGDRADKEAEIKAAEEELAKREAAKKAAAEKEAAEKAAKEAAEKGESDEAEKSAEAPAKENAAPNEADAPEKPADGAPKSEE
ncbi:MAG: hypothetical protein IJM44_02615 [Ruminococcus sp.]|nr:hypothetical protein [Ruminococcus sp.]